MYRLIVSIIGLLGKLLLRLEVSGRENVPEKGPLLIVFNHTSAFDAVLPAVLSSLEVTVFAAYSHRFNILLRLGKWLGNVIFVRRGQVHREALRAALEALKSGKALIYSPEGTRSQTGTLRKAKGGVAYLALRSGVPLLPVGIEGVSGGIGEILSQWVRFRRPKVTVKIGKAFYLENAKPGQETGANLREMVDTQVMPQIRSLLPSTYHGAYQTEERPVATPGFDVTKDPP